MNAQVMYMMMMEVALQYSRNGYGNAIIGRYGVLRKVYMVGLWYRRKLCGTREASNSGRVRVRIIHGLNISHKELIYLLQKSIS